eukprot:TRINITY_DN13935_c0_g1_i1.p1 TRINITY_DN13935_c0_g1~~TRINITY_DN13935_c0_g1_i1.p1  ORF type:complete len:387 (+),score=62.23 TRINITY_DN13935_c0_g1_i1:36-1163(+)
MTTPSLSVLAAAPCTSSQTELAAEIVPSKQSLPENGSSIETPLSEKITVLLSTSPVGRHPDTDLIDEVIATMQYAEGVSECRLIIVCDGYRSENGDGVAFTESKYRAGIVDAKSAANYEEYKARLREKAASSSTMEVFELDSRHGFGFAVRAALPLVRTPYVFVMQHDRSIMRPANIRRLVAAMERDPARLKYIGLPTATTLGHKSHVLSKYGIHIEAHIADSDGLVLMPLIQWYDSAHVCETEYYRNFVFDPVRKLVARGGFIEDKFGQFQLADIRKRGVDVAHPEYGTFIAVGPASEFGEHIIGHLDGRDMRNGKKFRFVVPGAKSEAAEIAGDSANCSVEATVVAGSSDLDVPSIMGDDSQTEAALTSVVAA